MKVHELVKSLHLGMGFLDHLDQQVTDLLFRIKVEAFNILILTFKL